jgi:putative ABC transport system permease protein
MTKWDRALFRVFLVLYPRSFRRAHARELEELYAWSLSTSRTRRSWVPAALRGFADAIRAAVVLRQLVRSESEVAERDSDPQTGEQLSPDGAGRSVAQAFGSMTETPEGVYEAGGMRLLHQLRQDVRYTLRTFRRAPGFTALAILTLALGTGATVAIFTVVHALLLQPLPYPDSDRLVRLVMNVPAAESPTGRPLRTTIGVTAADVAEIGAEAATLEAVGTAGPAIMSLIGHEDAGHLQGARVTASVFGMLGVGAYRGRVFAADDEAPDATPVVLLGYDAWHRLFGADPEVIGRSVRLGQVLGPRREVPHVIVGILPPRFDFPQPNTQFWLPFRSTDGGGAVRGPLLARLAPGTALAAAAQEVGPLVRRARGHSAAIAYELVREHDEQAAPARPALLLFSTGVGFVLLIACVNVANLLLGRAVMREREMLVRRALGASRGRLIRQLLTESLLLALAGGLAGAVLAQAGVTALRSLTATLPRMDFGVDTSFTRLQDAGMDPVALAFTLLVSIVVGGLCGVGPAVRGSRGDRLHLVREAEFTPSSRESVLREGLVVAQVASATVLLTGGTLLIQSFVGLTRVDPGFDHRGVLTFQVNLPVAAYPDDRLTAFAEELVERASALAGVRAAGYGNQLPFVQLRDSAGGLWKTPDPSRGPARGGPDARFVSRDYLDALGIRVLSGRGFEPGDARGRPRVLLVNETLARQEFGGDDPIGQFVYVGSDTTPAEIVGVVQDVRQFGLDREPEPQFFADFRQWPTQGLPLFPIGAYFAVRTDDDPAATAAALRRLVADIDQQARLFNVAPMERLVSATIARPRLYAVLLGVFAAVAIALAAVGVFSVVAYAVAQRTREMGIRLALGARRSTILMLVLRQSTLLTGLGVVLGLLGAAALAGYLEGMLFGVTPHAPETFAAVGAGFLVIATGAALLPAFRATRIDPAVALRSE